VSQPDEREWIANLAPDLGREESPWPNVLGRLFRRDAVPLNDGFLVVPKSRALAAETALAEHERQLQKLRATGSWLIDCLKDVIAQKPVRGLDEAIAAWRAALGDTGNTPPEPYDVLLDFERRVLAVGEDVAERVNALDLTGDQYEAVMTRVDRAARRAFKSALAVPPTSEKQ
jgi:hypothetical protein